MTKHRLDIGGFYPTGEAACVCGVRGNRADVVLHVTNNFHDSAPIAVEDDFDSGATKGHYLPNTPRRPAATRPPCRDRGCLAPLNTAGTCTVHFVEGADRPTPPNLPPPPPSPRPRAQTPTDVTAVETREEACPTCGTIDQIADLPEIAAWSCGHWIRHHPTTIAEAFQDMLRGAYHAGLAAAISGETFETWYQRKVLQ